MFFDDIDGPIFNSYVKDIRNLLGDWAEELADCERIFIRASVSNRRIFMGYEGAILQKGNAASLMFYSLET
jgi:hypothetical protein